MWSNLRAYYKNAYFFNTFPLAHQFTPSGNIAGAVLAASAVCDAVTVLHGPEGCGFHYRYLCRRNFHPAYNLICTALTEKDIIMGGEQKLRQTILETVEKYRPSMIWVIPSAAISIINEDVEAALDRLRREVSCKLVLVQEERISHADKRASGKKVFSRTRKEAPEAHSSDLKTKGCGFSQAMRALVTQVMHEQPVCRNAVNLCGFPFDPANAALIDGIKYELSLFGVEINVVLPYCTASQISTAPRAALNIVMHRVGWAVEMERRFGTKYYIADPAQIGCMGFEGLERLYRDISIILGLNEGAAAIIAERKRIAQQSVGAELFALRGVSCVLCMTDYRNIVRQMHFFQNVLGLTIRCVFLKLDHSGYRSMYTSQQLTGFAEKFIAEARDELCSDAEFYINPDVEKVTGEFTRAVYVVGSGCYLESEDYAKYITPPPFYPMDFSAYADFLRDYIGRFTHRLRHKGNTGLMVGEEAYGGDPQGINMSGAVALWEKLWLQRSY